MKSWLVISLFTLCSAVACGKKDDGGTGGAGESGQATKPASGDRGAAFSCAEKFELAVSFSADEQLPVEKFEASHTLGYLSGMSYNGKKVAKHGYLVVGNYQPTLGQFSFDMPTDPAQVAIQISIKTASVDTTMDKQKENYAAAVLEAGSYEPTWMGDPRGFQVSYFVGGNSGGPSISGEGAQGSIVLSAPGDRGLCGKVDFTSPKGTTIKGTFNVPYQGDLWAK